MAWPYRGNNAYNNVMQQAISRRLLPRAPTAQMPAPATTAPSTPASFSGSSYWGYGPDPELWNPAGQNPMPGAPSTPASMSQASYRRRNPGLSTIGEMYGRGNWTQSPLWGQIPWMASYGEQSGPWWEALSRSGQSPGGTGNGVEMLLRALAPYLRSVGAGDRSYRV